MSEHDAEAASADDESAASDDEGERPAVGPTPDLAPEAALRRQLDAVEAAADDGRTSGDDASAAARTLFDFAAPAYRQSYGSVSAFASTMQGPIYDRLVAATALARGPSELSDGFFTGTVLARHPDGDRTYEFRLREQTAGKYEGCWMTETIDMVYDGESPTFRRTPTVSFAGRKVTCEVGDVLRDVLLSADDVSPHNDLTQVANCGGNGLCGTCAVGVDGDVSEMESGERRRLSLPPHDGDDGLRLACQTCVEGDVAVSKHDGLWGQHVSEFVDEDGGDADPTPIPVTAEEYAGDYEYAALDGGEPR